MLAKSLVFDTVDEVEGRIRKLIEQEFQPNLAIFFASTGHNLEKIGQDCSQLGIEVAGCTTAGEIVDDVLYEKKIAGLFFDLDPGYFKVLLREHDGSNLIAAGRDVGDSARQQFENPAMILLSGGLTIDAEMMLQGIREGLGRPVPIYGGLAGDDLQMQHTTVFNSNQVTSNGIAAVVFDGDKIRVAGKAISGWESIGGLHTITKVTGNVVYEINGERAYDLFVRYFGISDEGGSKNDQLLGLQTNYPFQFVREGDRPVLRSPMVVDPKEGSIVLTSSIKVGDQFRFSYSPGFEIIEQTVEEFGKLHEEVTSADALVLFSCKGRHGAFGPLLKKEITGIYNYWKKPLTGFLSYGEFGNMESPECEFHNETCSLVLLKEN